MNVCVLWAHPLSIFYTLAPIRLTFLDSIYRWDHIVFFFLACFTQLCGPLCSFMETQIAVLTLFKTKKPKPKKKDTIILIMSHVISSTSLSTWLDFRSSRRKAYGHAWKAFPSSINWARRTHPKNRGERRKLKNTGTHPSLPPTENAICHPVPTMMAYIPSDCETK